MKTLFKILCFALCINLYSQDYIPLLTNDKYWDIVYWEQGGIIHESGGQRQYISGDTSINETIYKIIRAKLYTPTDVPGVFYPPFKLSESSEIVGFMREDTIEQKIYTYNQWDKVEYLSYDFSLGLGDTLIIPYLDYDTTFVDSITQVKLNNGTTVRQFYFSPTSCFEVFYIEGIGGVSSLMYPFDYCFESGSHLDAVSINDEKAICFRCYIVLTATPQYQTENAKFNFYPNPTSDKLILVNRTNNEAYIKFFSSNGQLVLINKIPTGQVPFTLDTSKLNNGLYFVTFQSIDYTETFTLIKK